MGTASPPVERKVMIAPEAQTGVAILEKIVSYLTIRGTRNRNHFEDYIEPVFKDTEKVAGNYIEIFTELVGVID
jgi:hypothetical protein